MLPNAVATTISDRAAAPHSIWVATAVLLTSGMAETVKVSFTSVSQELVLAIAGRQSSDGIGAYIEIDRLLFELAVNN